MMTIENSEITGAVKGVEAGDYPHNVFDYKR